MKEFLVVFSIISITSTQNISEVYKKHANFKYLDPSKLECGFSMTNRIIGGEEATMGQYPWMARLGYTYYSDGEVPDVYECGGSIISDLHVLTAAHCGPDFKPYYLIEVRLGEHDSMSEKDCDKTGYCLPPTQDIAISSYFCHTNHDVMTKEDDICLLRLAEPIKFGVSVQPICLPFYDDVIKDDLPRGEPLEVAGWGYYKKDSLESSPTLLRLVLPAVKQDVCADIFLDYDKKKQICAGGVIGKDSCGGDSGGPLMKPYSLNSSAKYFLLGIVSYGTKRCAEEVPGVYTDVREYLTWILDNLLT